MPEAVCEDTFAGYRDHPDLTLLKNPAWVFRETLSAWKRADGGFRDGRTLPSFAPARNDAGTLPWDRFPASLRADVTAWLDRLAGRDALEELPFRRFGPATLQCRDYQLRQFASALVHRGHDPASLTGLADLVAIEAFNLNPAVGCLPNWAI